MICEYQHICGGCPLRNLETKDYQEQKKTAFAKILEQINQKDIKQGQPIFIEDGQRRRATFAFASKKGHLTLGFNQQKSNELVNVEKCLLLTDKINRNIANIQELLKEICQVRVTQKQKNKKFITYNVHAGDVSICEVDNGLDIVLEFDNELSLEHRMIIFELGQKFQDISRISHRKQAMGNTETIIEKTKPFILISGIEVFIPAGTFLQASKEAETKLVSLVQSYIGETQGKIADLFCGVGTFSYPLSKNLNNKILAVDSSSELLEGFRYSVNKNIIPNIEIMNKNLFKYPLLEKELNDFEVIVFDPPRAGASAQVKEIKKTKKVIAVSCNPISFIKDANELISNGYELKEITLVDQFVYSNHSELVALFTRN